MFVALLIKKEPVINFIAKTLSTHIDFSLTGYNQSLLENLWVYSASHAKLRLFFLFGLWETLQ